MCLQILGSDIYLKGGLGGMFMGELRYRTQFHTPCQMNWLQSYANYLAKQKYQSADL